LGGWALRRGLAVVARGAGEQFGKPAAIACLAIVLAARYRTEGRRTGPPRRRPGYIARRWLLGSRNIGPHRPSLRAPAAGGVERLDIPARRLPLRQRAGMAGGHAGRAGRSDAASRKQGHAERPARERRAPGSWRAAAD